ncbi:MAG: hypothetical protein II453_07590 [Alphaproteobacteria bacterium]|nr:hypothetical protein [Alphaproteobacteria bacterium]
MEKDIITEDYVSFETAKVLKEKGFDVPVRTFYNHKYRGDKVSDGTALINYNADPEDGSVLCSAPTLQMACKYLREKYDLHIIAYPFKTDNPTSVRHYCCRVYKTFNLLGCEKYGNETLSSYEEAVEAAIKYCLTNLID